MKYSRTFEQRSIRKMMAPDAMSATALAKETGVSQSTLSRWLREATNGSRVQRKTGEGEDEGSGAVSRPRRPRDWSYVQKLRVIVEAQSLSDAHLGAFLRRKGLHETQLSQWREAARSALDGGRRAKSKPSGEAKRIRRLERELARKEKALAETAALLVLEKKAQAIWGDVDEDTEPRNAR